MKILLLLTTTLLGSLASLASAEIVDANDDTPVDIVPLAPDEIADTTVDTTVDPPFDTIVDTSETSGAASAGHAQQQRHGGGGKGTRKCDALPVCLVDQNEARDKFIDVVKYGKPRNKGKWRACNSNANVILYTGREQQDDDYVDDSDGYYNVPPKFKLKPTKAVYLAESDSGEKKKNFVKFSASEYLFPQPATKQKLGMATKFKFSFAGEVVTGYGHALVDAFDANTIHLITPVSASGKKENPFPRGDSPYTISATCTYFADDSKFNSGYQSERMECTGSAERAWFGKDRVVNPGEPFSFIFSSTLVPYNEDCPCDPAKLKCPRTHT